jgi:hypothetical protein
MNALALLPLLLSAAPLPQETSLEDVNRIARELTTRLREVGGNLLTRMEALRAMDAEYAGGAGSEVVALLGMQTAAEIGNYAEAHALADRPDAAQPPATEAQIRNLAGYEPYDALEVIADLARDVEVVMINEAHHVPQHRAFGIELLHALEPLGFTHFAAETLLETDTGLNERGHPTQASGSYTNEPVYGDLVRTALELGYRVVAYESIGPGDRELGQATNLLARTFDDPDFDGEVRVVVFAGYAHINELGNLVNTRAMAGQVKEITGIDPLTIDQTRMSERSRPELEEGLYRHLVDERGIDGPSVLVDDAAEPWSLEPGVRDVTLVHPRSVLADGRPTWLRLNGRREPHTLPADVLGDEERVLVEARAAGESADAIPVDRVEVVAGVAVPALVLPPGTFVVEVRSAGDELLSTRTIDVPRPGR